MRHGSLFSGIGGFDLAAEWMGWTNIFHCEWNPFCQKVLNHYWPNAASYDDICKTDFTIWRGKIDILTGGFPCQPYSVAGKRKGTEDSRHLWPEMLRAIRECKPTWIVGENVPGIISWSEGLVFEQVCTELENEGYEVQPIILPACGVNAPHRRDRCWFVAYTCGNGYGERFKEIRNKEAEKQIEEQWKEWDETNRKRRRSNHWRIGIERLTSNTRYIGQKVRQIKPMGIEQLWEKWDATNSDKQRMEGQFFGSGKVGRSISEKTEPRNSIDNRKTDWIDFPTVSPVLSGNDGISYELDAITFPKWRNESIKAAGNAIVPQVAYQIFKVIEQMNK